MPFVNVPQSKSCRYELNVTPAEHTGLFTDTFTTCVILVLFKNNRISLTHVDDCLLNWPEKNHPLREELNWVGNDCYKLIIRKDNSVSYNSNINLMRKIRSFYSKSAFSSILLNENEALAVSIDHKVFTVDPSLYIDWHFRTKQRHDLPTGVSIYHRGEMIPPTIRHPDEWLLHSTHILRYAGVKPEICYDVEMTHVLYDGRQWSKPKDEEKRLDDVTTDCYLKNMPLSPSVFQVFDNLCSKGAGRDENTMLISFYLQQYTHKNDYMKMWALNQNRPVHCKQFYDFCLATYKFDELFKRQAKESISITVVEEISAKTDVPIPVPTRYDNTLSGNISTLSSSPVFSAVKKNQVLPRLRDITHRTDWYFNTNKSIPWLPVSHEAEAIILCEYFKRHGFDSISYECQKEDRPPRIVIHSLNNEKIEKLKKIPLMPLETKHSNTKLQNHPA